MSSSKHLHEVNRPWAVFHIFTDAIPGLRGEQHPAEGHTASPGQERNNKSILWPQFRALPILPSPASAEEMCRCLSLHSKGVCLTGWLPLKVPFQREAYIPKCPFLLIPGMKGHKHTGDTGRFTESQGNGSKVSSTKRTEPRSKLEQINLHCLSLEGDLHFKKNK